MRLLFLNFYQSPENFHFEQAITRVANEIKNIELDIIHSFKDDFSPLATTENKKGFKKNFKEIKKNIDDRYDSVISLDFPWEKDNSCAVWLMALRSARKKIFVANHLLPMDEQAPFFVWLKEREIFRVFDRAYFYAFDHPSNFPALKKGAVRYRTYYIDTVYYSPQEREAQDYVTVFSAGSKERAFESIDSILKENPLVRLKVISNSKFYPAKKYADRFSLMNLNHNVFRIKSELASSDLVLVPIKDGGKNRTAGMAIAFMGMSMGKPVIVKSTRWMKDYISHRKNGFFYFSSSKISSAVKNAIKDRRLWQKIGKSARKTMLNKASLDKFARKLIKDAAEL